MSCAYSFLFCFSFFPLLNKSPKFQSRHSEKQGVYLKLTSVFILIKEINHWAIWNWNDSYETVIIKQHKNLIGFWVSHVCLIMYFGGGALLSKYKRNFLLSVPISTRIIYIFELRVLSASILRNSTSIIDRILDMK